MAIHPLALIQRFPGQFLPPLPPAKQGMELALKELEEAAEKEWLLSTMNVANLLGQKPSTVSSSGEQFENAGFIFTQRGNRKDGQIAWLVTKSRRP